MSVYDKSVSDKLLDGDYKIKLVYPKKPAKPEILNKRVNDLQPEEIETLTAAFAKSRDDETQYRTDLQLYRDEDKRLDALFRKEMEEEFRTVDHPKADLLWSKAWELGHSSGLHEVYNYYEDLVDLIR